MGPLLLLLAAGCVDGLIPDLPVPTTDTGTSDTTTDTVTVDTGPAPELVPVSHDRELRGVWIATVYNINWPSTTGLSSAQSQAELRDLLEEEYPQYLDDADDFARIRDRFVERKKQQNVIDFDDMLVRLVELLQQHPNVCKRVANGCRYVLVDEYQDTNHLQGLIACLLTVVHGNIMVVGDEAQSIYAFRGADVGNTLDFPKAFPHCETIRLEQNYRSTQPVLDLANAVLGSMRHGFDKELWSDIEGDDPPVVIDVIREDEQADHVVEQVLELREHGIPLTEMAVLFRSAFHANVLEVRLAEANIPFKKFGGTQFTEAAHVKDVFALMKVLANPRDAMSWFRVLQWHEGIGARTAERIATHMETTGVLDLAPWRDKRFGPALVHMAGVLDRARELVGELETLLQELLAYYRPILQTLHEDHTKRSRDLDALPVLASRYTDLDTFLAEVVLDPVGQAQAEPQDSEDEWLTLSTVHSAKGLEWHTVFVLNLVDGAFPSGYALDSDDAMDEERRLFYVAVTRARNQLALIRPRMVSGGYRRGIAPGCALLDEVAGLDDLVGAPSRPAPHPPKDKHPDIQAAEDRMAHFLAMFGRK